MTKKLYLDGCSFTYGLGLNNNETLEYWFSDLDHGGYLVTNKSRPGKSNLAIGMDTYQNLENFDTIVIGLTLSVRFYLRYQNHDLDFLPGRRELNINDVHNGNELSSAYNEFHKRFYTMYQPPFCDDLSDMLIDCLYSHAVDAGKKIIFFSLEPRKTKCPVLYPFFSHSMYLPDGHLNAKGTKHLYEILVSEINE